MWIPNYHHIQRMKCSDNPSTLNMPDPWMDKVSIKYAKFKQIWSAWTQHSLISHHCGGQQPVKLQISNHRITFRIRTGKRFTTKLTKLRLPMTINDTPHLLQHN